MLKLKMMLCRDVAAGRRRLSKQSVDQYVKPPPPPAWIMQPPDWQTLNRIISPSERLVTMQKQLERTQEVY